MSRRSWTSAIYRPAPELSRDPLQPNSHADYIFEQGQPLYEDVLVARGARAHGFQRTGKHIGHRIKEAIGRRHKRTKDDGRTLVWPEHTVPAGLVPYRFASEDVRAVDEIPLAELATPASDALHHGATTEEAIRSLQELLGLSRLREATRCRLEAAVTLARNHFL